MERAAPHLLAHMEATHGVRILHVCDGGSRAWGYASPRSDIDLRFVFVRRRAAYLVVERDPKTEPAMGIRPPKEKDGEDPESASRGDGRGSGGRKSGASGSASSGGGDSGVGQRPWKLREKGEMRASGAGVPTTCGYECWSVESKNGEMLEGGCIGQDPSDVPDVEALGYDLRKALSLVRHGNASLLEQFQLPLFEFRGGFSDHVGTSLIARLRLCAEQGVSRKNLMFHHRNTCKKHKKAFLDGRAEVILKKYFYTLRPLLAAELLASAEDPEATSTALLPPVDIFVLLERSEVPMSSAGVWDSPAAAVFREMLERKKSLPNGLGNGPHVPELDNWIDVLLERAEGWCYEYKYGDVAPPIGPFNDLFRDSVDAVETQIAETD
jgi:predicted nucleotidyltransferase